MSRDRDTFDMFRTRDRGRFGDNESDAVRSNADVRSDLIDLPVALHVETPAKGEFNQGAVLVSIDGDEAKAVWIPKSRCQVEKHSSFINGRRKDGAVRQLPCVTVTLSERLAKEKGLL